LITVLEILEYFVHLTKFTYNKFGYFYKVKQNLYTTIHILQKKLYKFGLILIIFNNN